MKRNNCTPKTPIIFECKGANNCSYGSLYSYGICEYATWYGHCANWEAIMNYMNERKMSFSDTEEGWGDEYD